MTPITPAQAAEYTGLTEIARVNLSASNNVRDFDLHVYYSTGQGVTLCQRQRRFPPVLMYVLEPDEAVPIEGVS